MEKLQSKLDQLRARIEGGISAQFLKKMEDSTRKLEASGIADRVLKVGDTAPTIALNNQQGERVNSQELFAQGPVVLTFYRGFWCPYCNIDLAHIGQFVPEFQSANATLLAVSPEMPEYSKKVISTQKLSFDILFDKGNELAEAFGLKFSVPSELQTLYRDSFNVNLKLYHGDEDWTLPLPARFVIDQEGIIRYAESRVDYRIRPELDELLETLTSL